MVGIMLIQNEACKGAELEFYSLAYIMVGGNN